MLLLQAYVGWDNSRAPALVRDLFFQQFSLDSS